MRARLFAIIPAVTLAMLAGGPVGATVFEGKEAFSRGDFAMALKELSPAADKGDPVALYYLGRMYQAGLGVPKDLAKGIKLLGQAAEGGDSNAQYAFGVALALGEGIEQDLTEGLKWMFIAVRSGNDEAQNYVKKLALPRDVVSTARRAAYKWHTEFRARQKAKQKELEKQGQ